MSLFKNIKHENKTIDLTKLRGNIKFETIRHINKSGCEYFCIKAIFENGTTLLIDMQLIELLNVKMHQAIKKSLKKDNSPDLMEELIELVSGSEIRDTILESIYK